MYPFSRDPFTVRLCAALLLLTVPVFTGQEGILFASIGAVPSTGQDTESLAIQSAPVRIVAPPNRGQWLRRLALFADDAAQFYEAILGTPVPGGTIRWIPDPLAASKIDAQVIIEDGTDGMVLRFDEPFAIVAEDLGVAFAQGYARWITAYSVARLYFGAIKTSDTAWADGAALFMTELLARRDRSTTPVLYNIEAAYSRAMRSQVDVHMMDESSAAARGKALATFRLLEGLYGEAVIGKLLLSMSSSPSVSGMRETILANLPLVSPTDPRVMLDAWMDPRATIDLGLSDVRVARNGRIISGTASRSGNVPVWSQVEVTLANGERLYVDIPASTTPEAWELEISSEPIEVRIDRDSRLPDINRSNNRYRFGDAGRIKEFFPLDETLQIGELHFNGEIQQVGRKRAEDFSVTLRNLTDAPYGLGLLVSAQWVDRPASRTQRRIFIVLPPGKSVVAQDFIEYPRRGTGRARVEARYWTASTPEALTERLLRDPADLLNSYLVIRNPVQVTGPDGAPLERLAAQQIASAAELTVTGGGSASPAVPPDDDPLNSSQFTELASAPFGVRILSPPAATTPIDVMTFAVAVDGPPATLLELYVNDEIVGRGTGSSARATFVATEDQSVYLLQALAIGQGGELASDTRLLQRGELGFGASVDLVTLNLTVRQPGGGFVEDLTNENFMVIEDGVPQEIVNFAKGENTAVSAAMLLDTSSSMIGGGIASARAGAKRLVTDLLRGNDRAMVMGFNDRVYLYADFTSDVVELRKAIDATKPDGGTKLFDATVESIRKVNRRSGRRALVILSDGLDVQSRFRFADVLEYTRQSDVLVYTIGLQLMHDSTDLGDASDAVRSSVENLRELAEATGGSAYFPLVLDELEAIYSEIATELESQYSVSYYPTNQNWDGEWRDLEVALQGRAGRIQARPGYYGVRPGSRQ